MLKHAFFSNDSLRRFGGSLVRFSCCPLPELRSAEIESARLLHAFSVLPKPFEPIRRQSRIAHRASDRAVA
jgi:hypothetical protein